MKRPQFTPWIAPLLACATAFATVSLRPAPALAQAPALQALDGGQAHAFDFASDEVEVFVPGETRGGRLKQVLENTVSGAKVINDLTSHVIVKVAGGYDPGRVVARTDAFRRSLPTSEVAPVLYLQGAAHNEWNRRIATDEILAILKDGKTAEQLAQQTGAIAVVPNPISNVARLKYTTPFHALDAAKTITAGGLDVQPIFKRLAQRFAAANVPNDELFPDQWHLVNTGQQGGTPGVDINVLPVWGLYKGSGVVIGVIDDCLQVSHPDLTQNCPPISSNLHHDFNDNDNDPSPDINRGDGHGTCVSGLIAARQNNGAPNPLTGKFLGVSGVAPEATLYGLRAIGGPFSDADAATAFNWHPAGPTVDITNNSWGYPAALGGLDLLGRAGLQQAATQGRSGRGIVTVFAAGNGRFDTADSNRTLPSNSRYVVTVGALNAVGTFSSYSSPGANLLVCAPGGGFGFFGSDLRLSTTDVTGVGGFNPGPGDYPNTDYTRTMNGTSSATPITSGTVALMLNANPQLGWRDVKEILASTARRVDEAAPDWIMRPALPTNNPDRFFNEGGFKFNHDYGAGLVDAFAAVSRALTWTDLGLEVKQEQTSTEVSAGLAIPDAPQAGITKTFTFSDTNLRLEQIEVEVQIAHPSRADLQITVTSPSGVTSVLTNPYTQADFPGDSGADYKNLVVDDSGVVVARGGGWVFTTTHHWGENSQGDWKLTVTDKVPGSAGKLQFSAIRLYGTPSGTQRVIMDQQHIAANEPLGAPVTVPIIVRRLGPATGSFTVDYQTTASSATAGSDYVPVSGTLTFNDGDVTQEIDLTVNNDLEPEDTETVNVVLLNLQGTDVSFGGTTMSSVDIIDAQSNSVTIAATDPVATETTIEDVPDPGVFTFTRTKVTGIPLTIHYQLSGTASEGNTPTDDYDPLPTLGVDHIVTIPAFEASAQVVINPRDDDVIEGVETVIATIVPSGTDYTIGAANVATVQIIDNDRPVVQILPDDNVAVENGTPPNLADFIIKRTPITNQPLDVTLSFGGTQILGTNYLLTYLDAFGNTVQLSDPTVSNIVEIPADQDSVKVTLIPLDDQIYQATKTVEVSLRVSPAYEFAFGFLTTTRINIAETDQFPDTKIPTVTLTTPKNGSRFIVGDVVVLQGTAADTAVPKRTPSVDKVLYRVNGGQWQLVMGVVPGPSTSYSVDVTSQLIPGFNTLDVQAFDVDGNPSKTVTSIIKVVKPRTLNVTTTGSGTVTGNQSTYEVGDTVKLTATPASGSIFGGWSGDLTSPAKVFTFVMPDAVATPDTGLNLVANFSPNPFTADSAGVYSGLVQGAQFNFETSAYLTATVGATGATTGKLTIGGVTYPYKGEFLSNGTLSVVVQRKNTTSLTLNLVIDLTPAGTRRITGSVDSATFTAAITADRAAYSKTHPADPSIAKNYTFLLPPANPIASPQDPRGFGIGKAKIGADGVVHFTGTLPDGTKAVFNQALSKDNTWPLFLNPYKKKGVFLGNIAIDLTQAKTDMNGTYDWYKPVAVNDLFFPLGFKIENDVINGSIYTAPSTGTPALAGFTPGPGNAKILLEEGALLAPLTKPVTYDSSNKITVTTVGADKLAAQIVAPTGDFRGTFTHPVSGKRVTFTGILFQKAGEGYAYFPGSSVPGVNPQSGRVTLTQP